MEAPNETIVSAPETTPETHSVEPQSIEPQAPVVEPIPAEPQSQENAPADNPEAPKTEVSDKNVEPVPEFDEKALEGILDEIAASTGVSHKFTFKEDVQGDDQKPSTEPENPDSKKEEDNPPIDPVDKVLLDELAEIAQIYGDENKQLQLEKETLTSELEQERTAKEEAITLATAVDEIWKDVVIQIPILDKLAEAKAKGEPFELPPIYREEVQKALQEHPIVGPLNRALINGEELPIAAFVKALSEHRRNTAPNMADVRTSVSTKDDKPGAKPNRLGGLRGVKPVTI